MQFDLDFMDCSLETAVWTIPYTGPQSTEAKLKINSEALQYTRPFQHFDTEEATIRVKVLRGTEVAGIWFEGELV